MGRRCNGLLSHYGIYAGVLELTEVLAKIAVGDYSDQFASLKHWQPAKTATIHLPFRISQGLARSNGDGIFAHPPTNFHRGSLRFDSFRPT